jgi:hypothetical protein
MVVGPTVLFGHWIDGPGGLIQKASLVLKTVGQFLLNIVFGLARTEIENVPEGPLSLSELSIWLLDIFPVAIVPVLALGERLHGIALGLRV